MASLPILALDEQAKTSLEVSENRLEAALLLSQVPDVTRLDQTSKRKMVCGSDVDGLGLMWQRGKCSSGYCKGAVSYQGETDCRQEIISKRS